MKLWLLIYAGLYLTGVIGPLPANQIGSIICKTSIDQLALRYYWYSVEGPNVYRDDIPLIWGKCVMARFRPKLGERV